MTRRILENSKVLITGGAGFIGSNLTETLLNQNNQVTVLDNFSTGKMENLLPFFSRKNFRLIVGDIRDLDRYKPFDCTHIAVLNYGSNLQLIDHDVILLREYVIQWGDTNQFEIIDSYNDVTCPDYGRIQ